MPPSAPLSYAWALRLEASEIDEDELSETAQEGLEYADELAQNRLERSRDPRRLNRPERLTPEHLAARYQVPVAYINGRIALARRQLFGNLSDAAIAKRVQRQKSRPERRCKHPRCPE